MTLGEQIIQLRKQKKMSQEDLADAMQISRQAVSKWENDQSNPDTENLIRLAAILEVDVNDLIGNQLPQKNEESCQAVKKAHPHVIWLLIGLLVLSVCVNILLAVLWGTARSTQSDVETIITQPVATTRWDAVTLFKSESQGLVEIELSEEDKQSISDHIWSGKYSTIGLDVLLNDLPNGGPYIRVTFVRNNIEYRWIYYGGRYIRYSVITDDGKIEDFYTLDDAEWNWIQIFVQ